MSLPKITIKVISAILIVMLLQSCVHYKRIPAPASPLPSLEGRYVKLVWTEVVTTKKSWFSTWQEENIRECYMTDIVIQGDSLKGKVQLDRPHIRKKHQVNLYIGEALTPPDSLPQNFSLPLSAIKMVELYDLDVALSIFATVVTGVVIISVLAMALLIYIMLTKESCPFVYVYNGTDYELTGEIYSGAINPGLERHDYLPLPNLKPADSLYKLKISNQMQEIQSTNLAELMVIDHPQGSQVLVDKYGVCQTLQTLQSPLEAHSRLSGNILPQIAAKDSAKFLGDLDTQTEDSKEAMFLKFQKPAKADTAKLVVRAKNSFWLDYTMGQFFSQFGSKYDRWYKKQAKNPADKQQQWSLAQGIPLSVYVKQNGEWQFVDYYNVVGPIAEKDMVMPIDVSGIKADTVELKLESGFMFWETDFVGMDFTTEVPVAMQTVPLSKAVDNKGKDVLSLLSRDDKKYCVMPKIGDEAILEYAVPHAKAGFSRSVFLHSKGHYEVIRNPKGRPDVAYLKTFMEAGIFSHFSRQLYLQMQQQVSR